MASEIALCADLLFEGRQIRLYRNGDLWFVLADVCKTLELSDPSMVASRLDPDEKGTTNIGTLGGLQEMLIVSEPGFYKLCGTSRKPVAKRLDRWVRHEVLPSIRKTGSYVSPNSNVLQEIHQEFREFRGEVKRDLGEFRRDLNNVVCLLTNKGRKYPTPETQRIHLRIIRHHYFNKCPCLNCEITIADDDGFISSVCDYHHQNNRWDNRATATIPLAKECHQRIEKDANARIEFGARGFTQFQQLLARMPMREPRLPGI